MSEERTSMSWQASGNNILNAPDPAGKVEAKAEAHRRRMERAKQAQHRTAPPRKFREMSVAARVEFMRRRKQQAEKLEEEGGK